MINLREATYGELVGRLGISPDHTLLQRSSSFNVVGDGRDELMVLGLVPSSMLGNRVYLCVKMLADPSVSQLRALKRYFLQESLGFPYLIVAEASGQTNCKFLDFFGFKFVEDLGDRYLYERDS